MHQWKQRGSWFSVVLLSKEDYLSFNMLNIGTKSHLLMKTCEALVTNSLEASQPDFTVKKETSFVQKFTLENGEYSHFSYVLQVFFALEKQQMLTC